MTVTIPMIAGLLLVVLLVAGFALRELFHGYEQRRALASRTALDEAERRANSPWVRLDGWLRHTYVGRSVERRILASGVQIRVVTLLAIIAAAAVTTVYVIGAVLAWLLGALAAIGVAWGV